MKTKMKDTNSTNLIIFLLYQISSYISNYHIKVSEKRLNLKFNADEAKGAYTILEAMSKDINDQIKLLEENNKK